MSTKKGTTSAKKAAEEVKEAVASVEAEKAAEAPKAGRKPATAAEKAEAAKVRAEQKKLAQNLKPVTLLQYQDVEVDTDALVEAAKAAFHEQKKRTLITDLKLYIKPEERAAYYVVNGEYTGSVGF